MKDTLRIAKPKVNHERDQRPASKRGMPESSVTRQHIPENTLRSKLQVNVKNRDLEVSSGLDVDSKFHPTVQIVKVCQPKQEINSLLHQASQ
jgi:hypothetical protein